MAEITLKTEGLESSSIKDYWYLPTSQTLKIIFHSNPNREYEYKAVPIEVFDSFSQAKSKGRFFSHEIRDKYSVT